MKTPRGASESSTTSDNTTEFIDIVKKYDVVYNTHNPDYKNVEVKMKVWSQIAEEIGLSVDASKRKWKNLRDSYTKYLRSFRIGTKTSKKYQYWAHAEHMDFLKPYQGPGRHSSNGNGKGNDDEDTECDLGFQVLTKATTTSSEEDVKITVTTNSTATTTTTAPVVASAAQTMATLPPELNSTTAATSTATVTATSTAITATTTMAAVSQPSPNGTAMTATNVTSAGSALVLPVTSLPNVQLTPQLPAGGGKPPLLTAPLGALPPSLPAQIFPLSHALSNSVGKSAIAMPASSTASSVGCLIIEPQMFASADTFKKELSTPALGIFHNITSPATATTTTARANPPLITKIRRVQPSPQTAAINLSFSATPVTTTATAPPPPLPPPLPLPMMPQPPPAKMRKLNERTPEVDVAAILHANRDLDANTLFFLSLARTVRTMPTKFQSLAKMRCMRIVSDIELELDNMIDCQGPPTDDFSSSNAKYCSMMDSPPPPPPDGTIIIQNMVPVNDAATEHFVYVMSPSRVESMIDISSDEEATLNGN